MSTILPELDWAKGDGLLPAIVQDADTGIVLMQGYVNAEALAKTLESGQVTFFSRSKQRLWTKGETSGHVLSLVSLHTDCDQDSVLILARPNGPTCHRGCRSCFDPALDPTIAEFAALDQLIAERVRDRPEGSYTTKLLDAGVRRIAQKVGEEGVETALAGVAQDADALISEAADLVYHLTVLLQARERSLLDVALELRQRRLK
ncbi:bifunctional phosphoribosyl-AMP cyclohydrolase/phosphoribosyl-ATP diphosphatase [Ahniella affigens]|uniref:Histidine biosynthesis bifunctional protein HisIE n=1 Tax=Ahniella affigens TaxID=2021234 RepID=A0A2P1PQ05_9GAMM|nr:bifunctional phosphoribosyl-AMP cyclohydrolase/phosphoribosyl-ATP diphosphatase HisIE [Ahniella affigens]AVP96920.1 bifunctional phosphoribosyl-AMP cyclohydrolase/phosphoribosyl-ATP diphosphatase [Ahniella affigens]